MSGNEGRVCIVTPIAASANITTSMVIFFSINLNLVKVQANIDELYERRFSGHHMMKYHGSLRLRELI